ncbi:MAG: FlgD immunoglobulin-like domain containing protein, partial [Planctomycetota bacterium]
SFTLVALDLQDLLGNVTPEATLSFEFEADTVAPALSLARATSATTVQLDFTEAVTPASAGALSAYSIDGLPAPTDVAVIEDSPGAAVSVVLTVGAPFPERQVLTVRASGLSDLAGNARDETSASFFVGMGDTPLAGDIAITEILFDPQTGSAGEFVELQNLTADKIFDLRTLVLDDVLDGDAPITDVPAVLLPGEFLVIVNDLETFRLTFPEAPAVEADRFPGLGNSGDLVAILASGDVIDAVQYDPEWHRVELDDATGVSLERRDPRLDPNDAANWSSSLDPLGGTPSAANSVGTEAGPPPEAGGLAFSPNPFDAGSGDAVQIAYSLEAEASLIRVRIYDGAGRVVRELEQSRLTGREGVVLWDGRDDRGEQLRIGPYIVLLEAVDVEGGTTEAYRGAVVLARQL